MAMLEKIHSPEDIKGFDGEELESLCEEMRRVIIDTVSANGGHLASNLGVVELTVALGLAFSPPRDTIVWDVGHQSYPYKLLTGRYGQFHTIRTEGGLAGFPCREESPYDLFTCGHSSTSISSALGVSEANYLQGKDGYVVAVIGDGALTGGLAYEGLNNAGRMQDVYKRQAEHLLLLGGQLVPEGEGTGETLAVLAAFGDRQDLRRCV